MQLTDWSVKARMAASLGVICHPSLD